MDYINIKLIEWSILPENFNLRKHIDEFKEYDFIHKMVDVSMNDNNIEKSKFIIDLLDNLPNQTTDSSQSSYEKHLMLIKLLVIIFLHKDINIYSTSIIISCKNNRKYYNYIESLIYDLMMDILNNIDDNTFIEITNITLEDPSYLKVNGKIVNQRLTKKGMIAWCIQKFIDQSISKIKSI